MFKMQSVPDMARGIHMAVGGTDLVIRDISEFFHRLIQRLLCLKLVRIKTFIFQCVEMPFHRGIVVGTSCFAHTLDYMDGFAEFHEGL